MDVAEPAEPPGDGIQLRGGIKNLKHGASDEELSAKLEEAKAQLHQYAGDGKLATQAGSTKIRFIAVAYRAWELAVLEEVAI